MIHYDLHCNKDHEFDGWFANSAAFDKQKKAGQLACPCCGSHKIEKSLMAPRIGRGASETSSLPLTEGEDGFSLMRKAQQFVRENFEDAGDKFAERARQIHEDDKKKKPRRPGGKLGVYGNATPEEAKKLHDDGIKIGAIPWPRRDVN